MKCIEVGQSRIREEKLLAQFQRKSARWNKQLASQLETAIEKLTKSKKAPKSSRSSRLYRITKSLAEVELPRFGDAPPLIYSVIPGEGETLVNALVAALRQLRGALIAGELDKALHANLLLAETTPNPANRTQSAPAPESASCASGVNRGPSDSTRIESEARVLNA